MFQTPNNPMSTGRLRSQGALLKCSSIWWPPARNSRNASRPIAIASETPIDDHIE